MPVLTGVKGISYSVMGSGRPVILVHGLAASRYDWLAMMPVLVKHGYRAYALDLLGHGDSYKPDDPYAYTIETLYEAFEAWMGDLDLEEPPLLVGHSLGGYLSLLYARRHKGELSGMALIDPLYSPNQLSPILRVFRHRPEWGVKAMRIVPEWLVDWVMGWDPDLGNNFSPYARRQIANDYKRASPYFLHITRRVPDLMPLVAEVEAPALVMWGARDHTLDPGSFPPLVQRLPHASGCRIADSGHQPHIGHPEYVSRQTLDFFASLP